jgi:hypothetical protein
MKKSRNAFRFTLWILLLWVLATLPTAVLAHDGTARVVLNQYEIAPGQPVEVSGINLGTDLEVQVMLLGEQTAVLLGNALCDGHGDFIQPFTLPTDLPDGVYTIQAMDTSMVGLSVVLAKTQFKIDETAVVQPKNSPYVVTFTNSQINWQQPLYLALAGLTLFLFLLPSFIKWRRSKNIVPLPLQSHIQKK